MSILNLIVASVFVLAFCASLEAAEPGEGPLGHAVKSIQGKPVELSKYKGRVVLIVNVASECGLTPQYESLQAMHEKYHATGLSILGFPCNQFGGQEPGSESQIQEFCKVNYGVKFDMFSKVEVNGDDQADLYVSLTGKGAKFPGRITWNFEKFLIGASGEVVARFAPRVTPDDPKLVAAIEAELAKAK